MELQELEEETQEGSRPRGGVDASEISQFRGAVEQRGRIETETEFLVVERFEDAVTAGGALGQKESLYGELGSEGSEVGTPEVVASLPDNLFHQQQRIHAVHGNAIVETARVEQRFGIGFVGLRGAAGVALDLGFGVVGGGHCGRADVSDKSEGGAFRDCISAR